MSEDALAVVSMVILVGGIALYMIAYEMGYAQGRRDVDADPSLERQVADLQTRLEDALRRLAMQKRSDLDPED